MWPHKRQAHTRDTPWPDKPTDDLKNAPNDCNDL